MGEARIRLILGDSFESSLCSYMSCSSNMSKSSARRSAAPATGTGSPPVSRLHCGVGRMRQLDGLPAGFVFSGAPKGASLERRCSSRTFRYGYLVTT